MLPLLVGPAAVALAALWWLLAAGAMARAAAALAVVLAHGVMGFTELSLGRIRQSYFRGIPERLRQHGIEVHLPAVPAVGSIAVRAEALAAFIRGLEARKVNIIAHSMGGLDARYAIGRLGIASRVASLTTIGTPHHGTPMADFGTAFLGDRLGLGKLLGLVGFGVDAFYDLTTEHMSGFNRDITNVRGVRYFSVVSAIERGDPDVLPLLAPGSAFLESRIGPSDGMVPLGSQVWGEVLARIKADHWAQIGWSRGYDAPAFYETLCRQLRSRGL